MSDNAQSLLDTALLLPDEDRAEIARGLVASLDGSASPEIDAAWLAEAKRRLAELRSGAVRGIPGDEVIAAAKRRSTR